MVSRREEIHKKYRFAFSNIKKVVLSVKTSKKGNLAILLSMIFVSLVFMVMVFIRASAQLATVSYCNNALELAGRAVVSEFHVDLKNNYGIFAFEGFEKETKADLKFYLDKAFDEKLDMKAFNLIKPRLQHISVGFEEYGLIDTENFQKEIVDAYPYLKVKKRANYGKEPYSQGKLINNRIKAELPSRYLKEKGYDLGNPFKVSAELWNKGLTKVTDDVILTEYILSMCNCDVEDCSPVSTFFQNEIEYILYGSFDDATNKEEFLKQFKTFRFVLNSAHIYADTNKRKKVLTAAETITPGPEAAVTAILIAEFWAGVETSNDRKLLESGKGVTLTKTAADWAINLDSIIEDFKNGRAADSPGGYIEPKRKSDMGYKQYLKLFLNCADRETKLVRLMDLIQLNIQGNFDENFRIKDYYLGFNYEVKINEREYKYAQNY